MKVYIFMTVFIMYTVLNYHLANAGMGGSKYSQIPKNELRGFRTNKEAREHCIRHSDSEGSLNNYYHCHGSQIHIPIKISPKKICISKYEDHSFYCTKEDAIKKRMLKYEKKYNMSIEDLH